MYWKVVVLLEILVIVYWNEIEKVARKVWVSNCGQDWIGLEFLALLLLNMGPSADYLDGLADFKVARCGGDGDGVHMEYSILSWNYTE
jgi:hypothetical protein